MRVKLKSLLHHYDDYDYAASSWRRFGAAAAIWVFWGVVTTILAFVLSLFVIKLLYVLNVW